MKARVVVSLMVLLVFASRGWSGEASRPDPRSGDLDNLATVAKAAERGDWDKVGELLQGGADANATQPDGMTALHWAVLHNQLPAVQRLLDAGADPNRRTDYGIPPLAIACETGSDAIVERLLQSGADAEAELAGGETMLMIAARTGRRRPVEALLAAGAKVDAVQREGQSALMWAAAEGHAEVVDALLLAGAKLDRNLKSGMNAMMFAAREGRSDVVTRLLAAGVDVNTVIDPKAAPKGRAPRSGMSALLFAIENGHFELAVRLVDYGADPNDQRSGYAPLHAMSWVRKANRGEDIHGDPIPRGSGEMSSLQFVNWLIDQGADVNLALAEGKAGGRAKLNPLGATPFLLAAKTADLPFLQLLVERGADPLAANADGCTPIMAAAGIGVTAVGEEAGTEPEVLETVAYLAELGADLNTIDDNGETVMHGAAYRSYPLVATLLQKSGADPHVWHRPNRYGWTPHLIAQGYRPGSFKPWPAMIAAIEAALVEAGIEPPAMADRAAQPKVDDWAKPKPNSKTQPAATGKP